MSTTSKPNPPSAAEGEEEDKGDDPLFYVDESLVYHDDADHSNNNLSYSDVEEEDLSDPDAPQPSPSPVFTLHSPVYIVDTTANQSNMTLLCDSFKP